MDIYLLDTTQLRSREVFNMHYLKCPDYRKKKIDSLKNERHRRLSLGVEILLANAMSERDIFSYDIKTNANGKPFIAGSDICFSLSHSGVYAAAAVSDKRIGIDIEAPEKVSLRLADRFFSEREQMQLEGSECKELEFLKIWTRKEAVIKASDTGLSCKLSDICTANDKAAYNGDIYSLLSFSDGGYIISVAHLKKSAELNLHHITVG